MKREKETEKKRIKKLLTLLKFAFFIVVVLGIPSLYYFRNPDMFEQFQSLEAVNAYLEQYQTESYFIYFGFQIIQILFPFIPGQFIQIAGGYMYPLYLSYPISILGAATGTTITFLLARLLGKEAIHLFFGEEKIAQYTDKLNSKRAFGILLLLFLIPGFPKDFISYAAGVSEIKLKPFLLISIVGRTPAMLGSLILGYMLRTESYLAAVILGVCILAVCIVCIWKRRALMEKVDRLYEKMTK